MTATGHGTHTASTAAGNAGVDATVGGLDFGTISGVAPAAKIAVYKALWEGQDGTELRRLHVRHRSPRIDQAVADGVDVINYSVGGTSSPRRPTRSSSPSCPPPRPASSSPPPAATPARAPPRSTTPSPWVTTVAASTVAPYDGTVVLGNGQKYAGISTTRRRRTVGPHPAGQRPPPSSRSGQPTPTPRSAWPGTLDPAKTAGKIVVCDRGVDARVDKSAEVKRAGGVGMVLVNLTDEHARRRLHTRTDRAPERPRPRAVKAYAAHRRRHRDAGPGNTTATADRRTRRSPASPRAARRSAPMATRSSRTSPRPGVNVLAAVAPPSNAGRDFDFYSGTSMAAPHVAGLAALYLEPKSPDWSPMAVKSALMTTAGDLSTSRRGQHRPVRPGRRRGAAATGCSTRAGLRLRRRDWLGYLEGIGVDTGTGVPAIDPSDYNSPSIAVGQLLGTQTITRRVTAVTAGLYRARARCRGSRPWCRRRSSSSTPRVRPGPSRSPCITPRRTTRRPPASSPGRARTPRSAARSRSPPRWLDAPGEVAGAGASGSIRYSVTPGVSGAFPITASGLSPVVATDAERSTVRPGHQAVRPVAGPGRAPRSSQFSRPERRTPPPTSICTSTGSSVATASWFGLVARHRGGQRDRRARRPRPRGTYLGLRWSATPTRPGTTSTPYDRPRGRAVTVRGRELGGFAVTPAHPRATGGRPIALTARWSGRRRRRAVPGLDRVPGRQRDDRHRELNRLSPTSPGGPVDHAAAA